MSQTNERKEKNCLNCGDQVTGRFCQGCGQKNLKPEESVFDLVGHFFHNLTHYDGKIISTLKYLLIRPGFLSREYLVGRRAGYLHPIHMYVVTSTFFFFIFFSVFHLNNSGKPADRSIARITTDSIYGNWNNAREFALRNANSKTDSVEIDKALSKLGHTSFGVMIDSLDKNKLRSPFVRFMSTPFETKPQYYVSQLKLRKEERDNWVTKRITYKQIEVSQHIAKDSDGFFNFWLNKLLHMLPQLLFVSLPLFALLLKMLYWRSDRNFANHAIFSIHLYIFTFVSLLVYFTFSKLQEAFHWGWIRYVLAIVILYIVFYSYQAMRTFYQQGLFKTFIKYCLLHLMSFSLMLLLFLVFFMLSIFEA